MEELTAIRAYGRKIFEIDYFNREGGRYAYLQFLYFTREMMLRFERLGWQEEIRQMQSLRAELNEQVGERFGRPQQIIFVAKQIEIKEMLDQLEKKGLTNPSSVELSVVRNAS